MATLLELDSIETNSLRPAPDPTTSPPDAEPAEVTQARELRRKIRMAGLRAAEAIMDDATDPRGDTAVLERIAWARQTVQNPDAAAISLLRLALADAPPSATAAQILSVNETGIQNVVNKLVPRLAKGLQVSPR